MSNFKIENNGSEFIATGRLNELSKIPKAEYLNQFNEIFFDLSGVTGVNSVGVRRWVEMLKDFNGIATYKNISSQIAEQFNMIPEFPGKRFKIKNMECLYFCDLCEEENQITINVCKKANEELLNQKQNCPDCESNMEPDFDPEEYFQFLEDEKRVA